MGCVASSPEPSAGGTLAASPSLGKSKSEKRKSIQQDKRRSREAEDQFRVVLVGPGESGKSTILKQMKILEAREKNSSSWSQEELASMRTIVYANAVSQMKLLAQLALQYEVSFASEAIAAAAKSFAEEKIDIARQQDPDIGQQIKRLWAEPAMRVMYNERDHLYNLNDGAGYFWESIDRLYAKDYVPSEQDILRVRLRTAAADEVVFKYKGNAVIVTDMGGQQQERAKWAAVISQASTVMFVSSLCEWDQKMREDNNKIRMEDSLELFEQVISDMSSNQTLIVLLNKLDLFTEKIRGNSKVNFQTFWTDYKGPLAPSQCGDHIKSRFTAIGKRHKANVRVHLITALETDAVRLLWHDIRERLLEEALEGTLG